MCGGCCRTFSSDGAGDSHRTGPGDNRRCLTDIELVDRDFRLTDRGWTNSKPMSEEVLARRIGADRPAVGTKDEVSEASGTGVPDGGTAPQIPVSRKRSWWRF